jgi:hypothetical protein
VGTGFAALLVGILSITTAADVPAQVTFDFNTLEVPRGDFSISNYMSDLYGSAVSTNGARTVAGGASGVEDIFIATSLQLLNRGDFIITFEDQPILGAQFEGHVLDATVAEDFRLRAFNGNDEIFSFSRNTGEESFNSGWLDFGGPVDRIIVSDSGRRDVGVDDLVVQPAPDPASGMLLLTAIGLALGRRSRSRR